MLTLYARGKKKSNKLLNQDKGQKSEVVAFIDALLGKAGAPISLAEIYSASLVTFKICESLLTGNSVDISDIRNERAQH